MWMFTRYGNYSAVFKGGHVQVRARVRDDLKRLIDKGLTPPGTKIIETADGRSDYRYRIMLSKEEWAFAAGELALDIDYPNFKSEVMKSLGPKRERPLHQIWSILGKLQPGGPYARKQHRQAGEPKLVGSGIDGWDVERDDLDDPDDEYVQARLSEAFTRKPAPTKRKRGRKRSGS